MATAAAQKEILEAVVACFESASGQMINKIKFVIQVMWAFSAVTFGTTIGAVYGWEHHGWIGAVALGLVGLCFGALAAASSQFLLQVFH